MLVRASAAGPGWLKDPSGGAAGRGGTVVRRGSSVLLVTAFTTGYCCFAAATCAATSAAKSSWRFSMPSPTTKRANFCTAAYRNIDSGDGTMFGTRAARALLGAYPPSRLVWGSDWPHTQHRDRTDYRATRSALDDWVPDPSLRRIILCDSARALYRFDR